MKFSPLLLVLLGSMLSGCASLTALTFRGSNLGGQQGQSVLVVPGNNLRTVWTAVSAKYGEEAFEAKDLEAVLKPCGETVDMMALPPLEAALTPALGKLILEFIFDQGIRSVENLKKASQQSYSTSLQLTLKELLATRCLVVVRGKPSSKEVGLVAVLRVVPSMTKGSTSSAAFIFQPTYVRAKNSVSITSASGNEIAAAFAVSIKAIGRHRSQPATVVVGEGVATVKKIKLGGAPYSCDFEDKDSKCQSSSPLVYPEGAIAFLSVGVAETGATGLDFDLAAGELKALKAALGPPIAEAIKKEMED